MGFSGELEVIGFTNVFQSIRSNLSTGTLRMFNERHGLHVYFLEGRVSMAAPLGIRAESDAAKDGARKRNRRKMAALLRKDVPEAQTLRAELQAAVCERIYDAFTWSTALFEFNEGAPPEDVFTDLPVDAGFRLEVEPILMEAARRKDEWARIHRQIRSLDEVLVQVALPEEGEPALEGLAAELAARLDGETPLRDVIAALGQSRFAVCMVAADLIRGGWIQPLSTEECVQVARRIQSQGRIDSALRLLASALEHERNDPALHKYVAELHDQVGRTDEAARSFSLAGGAYLALGKEREALASFAKAVDNAPGDPGVRESQLRLLLKRGDTRTVLQQGASLAKLYLGMGLVQNARDTYARLVSAAPNNDELKQHLARCERGLGNSEQAVKLYQHLVAKALKAGQFGRGMRLLHEILEVDPGHKSAQRILSRLESGRHAINARRRKRVRRIALFSVGAGLVVWMLVYELASRSYYHAVQRSNLALIAEGRHLEAIRACRSVREAYPWSLVRFEANMLIDGLVAQQLTEIERTRPPANHDADLQKLDDLLALSLPAEVATRVHRQIDRLQMEKRVLAHASALSDPERHSEAKAALLAVTDPAARDILEKLLTHPSEEVRFVAIAPLANMKDPRSIPRLIEVLKDRNSRVRGRARTALVLLTGQTTLGTQHEKWLEWWRAEGQPNLGEPPRIE